jgi:muconolactone delta-isomerase
MLYCIRMDVRVPHALAPEQLERLKAEEKARAQKLQRDGRWRHLWRVAGQYTASSTSRTMTNCTRFADNRVVVGEHLAR